MRILAVILVVITTTSAATAQTQPTVKGDAAAWQEVSSAWQRLGNLKTYRMKLIPPPGMQGADKMNFIMELVSPDRMRSVVDMEGMMTLEMIRVGQEYRRRITLKGQMAQASAQSPSLVNQILGGGIFGFLGAIFDPMSFVTNLVFAAVADRMTAQVIGNFRTGVWICESPPEGASSTSSNIEVAAARLGESTIEGATTQGYDLTVTEQRQGQSVTTKMRIYVLTDRQVLRRFETFDSSGTTQGTLDYYDYDAPITIELPRCE